MEEQQIQKILDNHKKMLEKSKERYHTVKKLNPEYMEKNRQTARDWYENNKDKRKEQYKKNKPFMNARSQYYYYKNRNRMEEFKTKHKDKYDLLVEKGFIEDVSPSV